MTGRLLETSTHLAVRDGQSLKIGASTDQLGAVYLRIQTDDDTVRIVISGDRAAITNVLLDALTVLGDAVPASA